MVSRAIRLAFNRGATDVTWSMKGQADERAQNTVKFTSARVGTLNGRGGPLSVTPRLCLDCCGVAIMSSCMGSFDGATASRIICAGGARVARSDVRNGAQVARRRSKSRYSAAIKAKPWGSPKGGPSSIERPDAYCPKADLSGPSFRLRDRSRWQASFQYSRGFA